MLCSSRAWVFGKEAIEQGFPVGLPAAVPGCIDEFQIMQVMEDLRCPRLRNAGLSRQRSRSTFLIFAAETYKGADDRVAARATRQRSPLRHRGRGRPPLPRDEPWRAQVKVPLGIRPGPAVCRQE